MIALLEKDSRGKIIYTIAIAGGQFLMDTISFTLDMVFYYLLNLI